MKKQFGMTLIELMISMMLGLGLVAGIGQLFVQSQKSFRLQQNLSDMTDDASFALEVLVKGILLAGFADRGDISDLPAETDVIPVSGMSSLNFDSHMIMFDKQLINVGEIIHGDNNQFIFRYKLHSQAELNNSICTRDIINFIAADQAAVDAKNDSVISMRVYKQNDTDGIPVLYCKPQKSTDPPENAQPLISDVEKIEFRYGVRIKCYENTITKQCEKISNYPITKYNAGKDTFFYGKASDVDVIDPITNNNNWANVFAVKVFLVMRSADDNLVRVQNGYKIDGVVVSPVPTDKRLYKTFSKTIFLRANDH